jgi:hypothetical protein
LGFATILAGLLVLGSSSALAQLDELTLRVMPNQATAAVQIEFTLAAEGHAQVSVVDVGGRVVGQLLDETILAGPRR